MTAVHSIIKQTIADSISVKENVANLMPDSESLNLLRIILVHSDSESAASTAQRISQNLTPVLTESTLRYRDTKSICHAGDVNGNRGSEAIKRQLYQRLLPRRSSPIVRSQRLEHRCLLANGLKLLFDFCWRIASQSCLYVLRCGVMVSYSESEVGSAAMKY